MPYRIHVVSLACLTLLAPAAADDPVIEIHRFDLAADSVVEASPDECVANGAFGKLTVQAYLIVIRLEPGARFVSARAELRDGFFCMQRKGPVGLGRVASQLAFGFLEGKLPPQLHEGLALVARLADRSVPPASDRTHRLERLLQLKAATVEHQEGYVAALLLAASGPATRLGITRIVTRRSRHGARSRTDASSVAVPRPSDPGLPRGRVLSILTGADVPPAGREAPR